MKATPQLIERYFIERLLTICIQNEKQSLRQNQFHSGNLNGYLIVDLTVKLLVMTDDTRLTFLFLL